MCEYEFLHICFHKPQGEYSPIFSFSEFISALALLVIVYTISSPRYKFRAAISSFNLYKETYILVGIIGLSTLLTDIWTIEQWLVPESFITHSILQAIFAFFFLALILQWVYGSYISPPVFGKHNAEKYFRELYKSVINSDKSNLPMIAEELSRSSSSVINFANSYKQINDQNSPEYYAYNTVLLLGNKKLCRQIMATCPTTAIEYFYDMSDSQQLNAPVENFCKNISAEAITNNDSILYHEDDGYTSGLTGYSKPFSRALYGDYNLLSMLHRKHGSTLDIPYEYLKIWKADQYTIYARLALLTLKSFMELEYKSNQSKVIEASMRIIKDSSQFVFTHDTIKKDYYYSDDYQKLNNSVDYFESAVNVIEENGGIALYSLRLKDSNYYFQGDLYDHIAHSMFEIIFTASTLKGKKGRLWDIHYSTVWSKFFNHMDNESWKIVRFKLRRALYDEIMRLNEYPNYKSSRVLGFCLYVMGLTVGEKDDYGSNCYPLRKAVINWTKKNFLKLYKNNHLIAESCLIGSLGFDKDNNRLYKTYNRGLRLEEPKEYLDLEQPEPKS